MHPILILLIATGLASLIGLEREMRIQNAEKYDTFGGLRTFAMLGALGAMATLLSENLIFFVAGIIFAMVAISHTFEVFQLKRLGLTSEFSALASFLIGVMVAKEQLFLAITAAILFTGLLALKDSIHQIVRGFEREELFAILKFLIISAIVLPLVPNEYLDKWEIFNPYHIWLMVIFVSGIRFIAFFLSKIMGGKKSLMLAGMIGGLASSTAVTSTLSNESKQNENQYAPFLVGILAASILMFLRVFFEISVVNPSMSAQILPPLLAMAVTAVLTGIIVYFVGKKNITLDEDLKISQPFSLAEGLKFGIFFLFILAASKIMPQFFGNSGLYATGAFSGLADTDAITLSMANLSAQGMITLPVAVTTVLIAVMVNTLVKIVIVFFFGSRNLFRASLAVFLIIFAVGSALLFLEF